MSCNSFIKDYNPLMCGLCKHFTKKGKRSDRTGGLQPGVCSKSKEVVYRTDWCHEKNEMRMHRNAMNNNLTRSEQNNDKAKMRTETFEEAP